MKKFMKWSHGISCGLILMGLAGCNSNSDPQNSAKGTVPPDETRTVSVTRPTREDLSRSVNLTAEFRPYQEVEVHAKVAGYIQKINVDVGDHVKVGDVLAILEIPELEEDLRKAEAAVLTANQEVESAEASSKDTDQILSRLQSASRESVGLIAQQDLDTATAKSRVGAANLAAARQRVVEAQSNADRMRTMLSYSKITAPFDGVVTKRYVDTGALVQAGTSSNTQPLVSLAELQRLRLDFPVPESAVAEVHVGDPVEVSVVSSGQTFSAKVSRFAQKVESSTRTMLTEVDVANPDFNFTPGMYATVRLTLSEKKDALAVPIQSVSTGENPTVLVLNKDHKVEERSVKLGLETSSKAEILSGLNPDDLIVMGNRNSIQLGEVALAREMDGAKL